MKQTYAINTKVDEDSDAVTTQVTVDFDGFTLDHAVKAFFTSTSPRVLLQSRLRKLKAIPSKYDIKALDLLGKAAPTVRPMTFEEMLEQAKGQEMTPEQKAQWAAILGVKQ